ncbi:phage tail tape measure protein [Clostridium felsineum]|uniref:phage tail tape measure protein n=1 Tax=Clostridium felsineum TaxID=36839 RepID=UPI00098C97F5|nr:phage tail tape measure protein [Clostridium felsineum]URZ15335.1 Chromosome partition protein Smc [Clostridium felsineum DSM 794]
MADQTKKINIQYILDDSGFSKSLQGINSNLKLNKSALNEANIGVKAFGESNANLTKVQKSLQDVIASSKQKVDLYAESIQKTSTKLQDNIEKRAKLKEELDMEKEKLEGAISAYGKESEVTQNVRDKIADLTEQYNKADKAVETNAKSIESLNTKMNNAIADTEKYEGQLKKTNDTISKNNNVWLNSGKVLTDTSKKIITVGEGMSSVGSAVTTKFTLPFVGAVGIAVKSGADFEHQMADIRKELIASGENVDEVDSLMKEMSTDSLQWSGDFGQSTSDINAGLLTMKKDGYSGREAIDDLKISLTTARGANESLTDVINTLGGSLEAYGMKTENAAQNTQNMAHIADSFAYIANHTKSSVTSLGEGISIAGQTLSQMNQPIEVTSAAIGELESNNIDASTAANALKAGFVNLVRPTDAMAGAMKQMNLQVVDSKEQMKQLPDIIDGIKKGTQGWTEEQRNNAIATLFGKESLASWNALINKGGDNLRTLSNGAKNSTGEVNRLSDSMKNTPVNQFKELEGSVKALGVSIGEDVLPTLTPLIQDATGAVKAFGSLDDGTKRLILEIGTGVAVGGLAINVIGKTVDSAGKLLKVFGQIGDYVGKKVFEKSVKDNSKAQDDNTKSTASNTEAKGINTEAESTNTEATTANTEAKNLNTEAENAKGGIENTAKREAETVATKESTIAQEANTLASGKGVKATEELGKTVAETAGKAGIAGEAVAGLGEAGELGAGALAGASTATVGLGTALATVALPIAGVVAGIGALSYGAYKFVKWGTDDAIPTTDIFNNKYKETSQVIDDNGNAINVTTTKMLNFSKATKDNVTAYMDLEKQAVKTGISIAESNNKLGITPEQLAKVKGTYDQMTGVVNNAIDKRTKDEEGKLKDLFSKSTTITGQEQQVMLQQIQTSADQRKQKTQELETQLTTIYQNASNQHRNLTTQEEQQVNNIQAQMRANAVKNLSDSSIQQKVLLERLKDDHNHITQQEAEEVIQNANKARDGAVSAANTKYNDVVANAIYERDVTHTLSSDQADKVIKEAGRQKEQSISEAEKQRSGVIDKVQKMGGEAVSQINTDTGKMTTRYQQWSKDIEGILSGTISFFKNHPIVAQIVQLGADALGAGGATKAITGKNARGTSNWQGGLTTMHEAGWEVYNLPQGTKIYNHEASEFMVKQTAQEVAKSVLAGFSGNGNNQPIVVEMYMDKDKVGRAVASTVSNQIYRNSRRG